jgi:hypothetical protein
MKKLIVILCLMAASCFAQTNAQVRVRILYTNEVGREISKTVTLNGWTANWDGTNWTAQVKQANVHELLPENPESTVGTPEEPFTEGYFSSNSLHVGNQAISSSSLARFGLVGKQSYRIVVNKDYSITNTVYEAVDAPVLSMTVSNDVNCSLLVLLAACGKAAAGESLSLTLYVDGVNAIPMSIPIVYTESSVTVPLGQTVLYPVLMAGQHTVMMYAKVSGGTGLLQGTKAPIEMAVISIEGSL